jgi:UMF1 family MFS transporter
MNAGGENKDRRSRLREQRGWYFYDWANSAFFTTVITVFLGPYLTAVTESAADANGLVYPLGIPVLAGSYFPYVLALSVALQVFLLPLTGAIADRTGRKKRLLMLFAYVGAVSTMGLYLVQGSAYLLGGVLFVIANLSAGASIVVYNAFLPEISGPDERDRVSSRAWALGYLGGGLLLAANLALFSAHESLGLSQGHAVRFRRARGGRSSPRSRSPPSATAGRDTPRNGVRRSRWRVSGNCWRRSGLRWLTRKRCSSSRRTCYTTTASRP